MEPLRFIRSGIAASAIGHLSILTGILIFAEVHPFGSVTAKPIAVEVVTPEEVAPVEKKPDPIPDLKLKPSDVFELPSKSTAASPPAPAAPPPQAASQQEAAPPRQAAMPLQQQDALPAPRANQQQAAASAPPPAAPAPAYVAPQPDLSLKYHVMLGLPPELPPAVAAGDKSGDGFVVPQTADIASNLVTEFRRHLKTCLKLPRSIAPTDDIKLKVRVFLTPDGKLGAEPALMEGSASIKGFDLKQSAIDALQACQPYRMLPADRYGEWKVLDLSFTPRDFAG